MQSTSLLWPDPSELPRLYGAQRAVLPDVFRSPVGILAGTPGTGKSFVTAQLITHLTAKYGGHTVAVAAPTGKAAVRITEFLQSSGIQKAATTIHRLLEVGRNGHDGNGWGFQRHERRQLDQRFFFIDETSMLDTNLAASLFRALPDGAHVLFVGDPYQLPPVGHGAPMRDMIKSGAVGYGELKEVHRNAGDIVFGCRRIKDCSLFHPKNRLNLEAGENWLHIEARRPVNQVAALETMLKNIPDRFDPVTDVQVICALNGKAESDPSPISRVALNNTMQALLNPQNPLPKGRRFAMNDKVICNKNIVLEICSAVYHPHAGIVEVDNSGVSDFVSNGEAGRVVAIDDKKAVIELFAPCRCVLVPLTKSSGEDSAAHNFDLGYAVTCHKMQGSQSPVVIIMLDDSPGAGRVASREWHYTAVSRAEQVCVTIGKWDTLWRQCGAVKLNERKTFLTEKIQRANARSKENAVAF